jgi:acetyltransferase
LQGTEETLRAIQSFVQYARFRRMQKPMERGCPSPSDVAEWRERLRRVNGALSEVEARRLLAAYGIAGPREGVATTVGEAIQIGDGIGYPVVVKILSPDIQHKTEIGAVRVGLTTDEAVAKAYQEVVRAARHHHPRARLDGVLVQEMIHVDATEVILGILKDVEFGPVLLYGSGGVFTELLQDAALRLPPLSVSEAQEMIQETRGAQLLRGFRGRPPADVDALVDALVRLSQLAVDLGDLMAAFEINPLMVLPQGQGIRAVDTLVELAPTHTTSSTTSFNAEEAGAFLKKRGRAVR